MDETIAGILLEFNLDLYRPILPRQLSLGEVLPPRAGNLVKVITGMRRSGKSYRLFQEMDALIAHGVAKDRICYFNFEDDRLAPVTPETGDRVLETFRYLHPDDDGEQGIYLFFDELQEMEHWGAWLRRIVDTTKATIYVTGSSSKMLSSEIASEFRGRAIDFELLPYSFAELVTRDSSPVVRDGQILCSAAEAARYASQFDEYLECGGFPAAQGLVRPQAISLLQSYVQRVVARDVVDRHNLARPRIASAVARRLMGANGRALSLRKIESDLRTVDLGTSRSYLADMLGYFESAYLIFTVREFSRSLAEASASLPKVYAIDPGLALANSKAGVNDKGQRLEDAVYLELRRRHPGARENGISFRKTRGHGYEIDFAIGDALDREPVELIQVTESVEDPKTAARETRALWEALAEARLEEGLLIVGNGDDAVYEQDSMRIRQVPAWKWFLMA